VIVAPPPMFNATHRKTFLIFSLALSLATALVALALQEDLREKLGPVYYILGLPSQVRCSSCSQATSGIAR